MKTPKCALWTIALALGLSSSLVNANNSIPQNMAAVGDSITAGALAGFKRTDGHNPFLLFKILYYFGKMGYMGSLNAFESRGRSWATGNSKKVQTHYNRLKGLSEKEGHALAAYNAAVSGASSYQMKEQVDAVLSWSQRTSKVGSPDYVLMAIGANDACKNIGEEMTPVSTYSNNIRNAVYRILDANPNSKVFISGIPNLEHLRRVAENSWLSFGYLNKCKSMWATHNFCNNVLLEKDPQKIREVTERIWDYQNEIEYIRREANTIFGEDRVRFGYEVHNYKFTDDDISIDCFHPNVNGQQVLADVTWKKTWWKDLQP